MERLSRAQRERERRRTTAPGWRGDGVRCGGMRTHGEVLLQRVSKLHLQVDRKEVGRGSDSDESRVHTWTKRHGDVSMRHDKNMRTHRGERDVQQWRPEAVGKPDERRIRQAWL